MRRYFGGLAAAFSLCIASGVVAAAPGESDPPVKQLRSEWRALNGDSLQKEIDVAKRFAHFHPFQWLSGRNTITGDLVVDLQWKLYATDEDDEAYVIEWSKQADEGYVVSPAYARPIVLGASAFVISLNFGEGADSISPEAKKFVADLKNVNFVHTKQGDLGDLLKAGGCRTHVDDPVSVEYVAKGNERVSAGFHFEITVDCARSGPDYFTDAGIIGFQSPDGRAWKPVTAFARRIDKKPPAQWFDFSDITR